jgi:C1A family cysteine protease
MPTIAHFDHPEAGRKVRVGACHRDPVRPEHTHYDASDFHPDDLPSFVDLRPHLTPVEDQGDLGSCTANALAGAIEYLEKRVHGREERVSRLFLYWNERDLEGKSHEDHGACLDDGIRALHKDGICTERIWPYDIKKVFHRPADHAYDEAESHTIDEAHRVKINLHDMRHCLAEGYPFVFGLTLAKTFDKTGHDGKVKMPDHNLQGGHAMLCVGYSDKDEVFVVRNSWGPKWGDKGYCYIPYAYLANEEYAHDLWTVRKAHDLDFNQGVGETPPPHGEKESFFAADDSEESDEEETDSEEGDAEAEEGDEEETEEGEEGDEEESEEEDSEEGEDEESDKESEEESDEEESEEDAEESEEGDDEESEEESTEEVEEELSELQKQEAALKAKLAAAKKKK